MRERVESDLVAGRQVAAMDIVVGDVSIVEEVDHAASCMQADAPRRMGRKQGG